MRQPTYLMVSFLTVASTAWGSVVWTETFDTGVGRFNQTRDNGDAYFLWNSSTKRIDGSFYQGDPDARRFALLDRTLDQRGCFGFSALVTPTSANGINTAAMVGFWDSTEPDSMISWLGVQVKKGDTDRMRIQGWTPTSGKIEGNQTFIFTFGISYFIDFWVNEIGGVQLAIYDGVGNPLFSDSISLNLDHMYYFDSLGMGDGDGGSTTICMSVDNVSFIVPEPATCMLIAAAGYLILRLGSLAK